MRTGKLWWIASNQSEANQWKETLERKGAFNFELKPHSDGSAFVDVLFCLEKERSTEILGYEIEESEWLTEEDAAV